MNEEKIQQGLSVQDSQLALSHTHTHIKICVAKSGKMPYLTMLKNHSTGLTTHKYTQKKALAEHGPLQRRVQSRSGCRVPIQSVDLESGSKWLPNFHEDLISFPEI